MFAIDGTSKISSDLVAGREVVHDYKQKKKVWKDPKVPKHAKRQHARFRVGQPVWYKNPDYDKRYSATITQLNKKTKLASVEYKDGRTTYDDTNVMFIYLTPKN